MRTAVVGHVEWVEFVRVARLPRADEIAHAIDRWEEPGGGGPVAAAQLLRLSGDCTFFTAVGVDDVGDRSLLGLEALGLRVEAARRPVPSRRAVTFIDVGGERSITVIGERSHPRAEDPLPWSELEGVDAVYVCAADAEALRLIRRARVVVATSRVSDLLTEAGIRLDAVVGSASDPAERFDPSRLSEPPAVVVRTEGAGGGSFETAEGRAGRYAAAEPPGPLVDRYGAGDVFAAGLAFALARGDDLEDALALAARCGAWCVAGRGPYGRLLGAAEI
jgi:ribokinase